MTVCRYCATVLRTGNRTERGQTNLPTYLVALLAYFLFVILFLWVWAKLPR